MNDTGSFPSVAAVHASVLLLARAFAHGEVTRLRHAVADCAAAAGLTGARLDDYVLAVNELITNAVRHGGGQGRLRLWCADQLLHCAVSDTGGGIATDRLDTRQRPDPDACGGWGLWLARQLTDEMVVESGPGGTTVRVSARLGPPPGEGDDAGTVRESVAGTG
ncbi:ATP-binding protein [Micromonospora sp. HM5-17]|jgi:anti-sigma regulatory factor (Ser/Thr protein kinase)|nr:ATP-binding protein [Micromonospora sp. HM5-17]ROT32236.1 ATP-binding protein [Micromonospora sp. HM5-17]